MKFYVIEVPKAHSQIGGPSLPFERFLETSMAGRDKRLLNILQRDAFDQNPYIHMGKPRVFTIDVPTPVTQSTVRSLIKGDIYQYVVDEHGDPDPQPNPWTEEGRAQIQQVHVDALRQKAVEKADSIIEKADSIMGTTGLAKVPANPPEYVAKAEDEDPDHAPQFPGDEVAEEPKEELPF